MRILVDILHPAHVHFFKHAIWIWQERGHEVRIVTREKDIARDLLDNYGFVYDNLGSVGEGLLGLAIELVRRDRRLWQIVRHFKPDILLGIAGTSIAHVGWLSGIPSIAFTDTEHAKLSNFISFPFATKVCVPACYQAKIGKKEVRYNGYHELAYLHPNRFTPNPDVLTEADIETNERFFVVRFVSWEAAHDVGQVGFSIEGKRDLVQRLSKLGRVIITSEASLPPELLSFQIRISPTKIHDLLAFSSLYIGESATMASESAILETPFIFVSPVGRGYTDEQEKKYGLGYTIGPDQEERAIELAMELVKCENLHEEWQAKRKRLLRDKIDVTAWMVDFVEQCVARDEKGKIIEL